MIRCSDFRMRQKKDWQELDTFEIWLTVNRSFISNEIESAPSGQSRIHVCLHTWHVGFWYYWDVGVMIIV